MAGEAEIAWRRFLWRYCHVKTTIAHWAGAKTPNEVYSQIPTLFSYAEVYAMSGAESCPIKAPTIDPRGCVACPVHVVPNGSDQSREKVGKKVRHLA